MLERRGAELKVARARHRAARERQGAVSAHLQYDEAVETAARRRACRSSGAATSARPTRPRSRQQFDRPVLVHRYPSAIKAFYMKPDPERPEVALCVDMLAPEGYGEIIGGGQRIDDYDLLLQRIEEHGLPKEAVRVVSRSAPLRQRAARRLRHGHRARGRPGSAASSICARRFRIRACCTGFIRDRVRLESACKSPSDNEDWLPFARLSQEPRRRRGDARHGPRCRTRRHAGRLRRGRARRQYVRLHRFGKAGIDRRDPGDGRSTSATATARAWS